MRFLRDLRADARSMTDPLSPEALRADVMRYADLGEHRTASMADLKTAGWIKEAMSAAGLRSEFDTWSLRQFQLGTCWVETLGTRMGALPLWHPTPIGKEPVTLPLVSGGDPTGKIALVLFEDVMVTSKSDHSSKIESAAKAGARAIVGCAPHGSGEIYGQNVIPPHNQQPWPIPVLMVAPKHWHILIDAADHRDTATLCLSGIDEHSAEAHNVVSRLDRGPRWIIVSTPQSGWFRCAGERGAGIALLLGLARWAARSKMPQSFLFLSNSGHEIGHMGIHHIFEQGILPRADQTDFWLHLGASIGTRAYSQADGILSPCGPEPESWLFCSSDLQAPLQHAFEELPHLSAELYNRKNGEIRWVLERGYSAFSLMGPQRFFHLESDGPEAIDADMLSAIGKTLCRSFAALASIQEEAAT